jgi:hypothetical protein
MMRTGRVGYGIRPGKPPAADAEIDDAEVSRPPLNSLRATDESHFIEMPQLLCQERLLRRARFQWAFREAKPPGIFGMTRITL